MKRDPDALPDPGPLFRAVPEARREAADAAAAHADREAGDDWQGHARALVLRHASIASAPWLSEDALAFARAAGLAEPPDARAFGAAIAGLSRAGLIVRVRFDLDKFGSPKPVWTLKA